MAKESETMGINLRHEVEALTSIERPSASEGERQAAEWIRNRFEQLGVKARIEEEKANGTYWVPLGVPTGAAAAAGLAALRGHRLLGTIVAAAAAAAVLDDIIVGPRLLRRLLPRRPTYNVVAQLGPADAKRTVVLVAHHDAARQGLIFHPKLERALPRRFPATIERSNASPPVMWPVLGAPLAIAAGSVSGRRSLIKAGTALALALQLVWLDLTRHGTVPGANDNATGVAALFGVARALVARASGKKPPATGQSAADDALPSRDDRLTIPDDTRVIFLSTGSEESLMEGMDGFARRHFPKMPLESTYFICIDTVGSPFLWCLAGEGMLKMREYPKDMVNLAYEVAEELDIYIRPDQRWRNSTDGLLPLQAGYKTLTLLSADEYKVPTNYHWPTDTAERVDYTTLADTVRLCTELVRRLSQGSTTKAPSVRRIITGTEPE